MATGDDSDTRGRNPHERFSTGGYGWFEHFRKSAVRDGHQPSSRSTDRPEVLEYCGNRRDQSRSELASRKHGPQHADEARHDHGGPFADEEYPVIRKPSVELSL